MPETIEDIMLETGEVLFDTTQPLTTAFFILEGHVNIELTLGEKKLNLDIGPNQFVGDAAVAVSQKADAEQLAYHSRAVATETVKAAPIPIEDIKQQLDACPPLLKAWFASFTSRVLILIDQLSRN